MNLNHHHSCNKYSLSLNNLHGKTILDFLESNENQVKSPAITEVGLDGSSQTVSYPQLMNLSRKYMQTIYSDWQLKPRTRVALIAQNSIASIAMMIALLRNGCPILLLNGAHPHERLQKQIKAVRIKLVLHEEDIMVDIGETVTFSSSLPAGDIQVPFCREICKASDDVFYIGTSGSTAISKIVVQSHLNLLVNAFAMQKHHGLGPSIRMLGCLPIHHVNGLHLTVWASLLSGAHMILVKKFDPLSYPRLLQDYKPKFASVVPTILNALVKTWKLKTIPEGLEYFLTAAAPVSSDIVQKVIAKTGIRVIQGYGLTETTNFSTTLPTDLDDSSYVKYMITPETPSIGVPVEGNELAILDEFGHPLGVKEVGEICIRGFNVMTRYLNNPKETANAFRNGWFHSQDLGYFERDSTTGLNFFFIKGRIKNIVKVNGEAVSLDEMNRALVNFPEIEDAACIACPNVSTGEEILAVLSVLPGHSISDKQILDRLRYNFPEIALPKKMFRTNSIPRTPTGKLLKPELLELIHHLK